MLAAMTTGERTYLTRALRVVFERTGSFHMLVVSALHLAIVAGFLFWLMLRLRLPQTPATLLTLAAACAYALFTGFGAPVQRSLWMVAVYLLGRLLYREAGSLNTLGFASLSLIAIAGVPRRCSTQPSAPTSRPRTTSASSPLTSSSLRHSRSSASSSA